MNLIVFRKYGNDFILLVNVMICLNIIKKRNSLHLLFPCVLKIFKLCLVTVFVFYFQKLGFENIKKKQFSYFFKSKTCLVS